MKEHIKVVKDNIPTNPIGKFLSWLVIIVVLATLIGGLGFLAWYTAWVTKVDNYELAFNYNWPSGRTETINRTGWIIRAPIVNSVHTIDLRPYQVTISANARILNAKLVRFNPDGLAKFIEWHGRGAGDNTTAMLEILKSYAFDRDEGKGCPFLTIIGTVTPPQSANVPGTTGTNGISTAVKPVAK